MILNVLIILRNNKLSIHKKKRYAKCNERLMKLKENLRERSLGRKRSLKKCAKVIPGP